MRVRRMITLASVFLLLVISALPSGAVAAPRGQTVPVAGYRLLTPPESMPELRGVRARVPAGVQLPPDDVLWESLQSAVRENRSVRSGPRGTCEISPDQFCLQTWPAFWLQVTSHTTDHSSWRLGSTYNNYTPNPNPQTLHVSGTVTMSTSADATVNTLIKLTFGWGISVSIDVTNEVTVDPYMAAALWGSAWRDVYGVTGHLDYWCLGLDGEYTLVHGLHPTGTVYIPYAPNFASTQYCIGCTPQKPPN